MSDVFKAIADPTRREILLTLAKSPENVNTISEKFNMSRPAVSKHIKVLTASNLVRIEQDKNDSRQRKCFAQLDALKQVNEFLNGLEKYWENKLDGLEKYLKNQ